MMKIKVCGMCRSENIAEISALNPDYMGFIFYDASPRFIGNLSPAALDILPANVLRVGVFVNAPIDYIAVQTERYRLDLLQLHGNESPEYCAELSQNCKIIKAFGIAANTDFEKTSDYENVCSYFLFDTKSAQYGGSGKKFNHDLLKNYRGQTSFFLSGGISPQDAENLHENYPALCNALDINSCFESAKGIKDFVIVKNFIEIIRNKYDKYEQNR